MLGEMRTSVSDMIFLKTERYLDGGVAYVPHTDEELASVTGETGQIDQARAEHPADDHGHQDHHHGEEDHGGATYAGTPTIIRPPEQDFRGIIGTMHRAIAPYRDPTEEHDHSDGTELLPWYRLMTMADPHSVRGYAIGSWWVRDHSVDEALRFVDEGIANNPDAFQLPLVKARLLIHRAGVRMEDAHWEDSTARPDLEEALALAERSAAMALQLRPADPEADAEWFTHMEEDALGAARLACSIAARLGDRSRADALAREYMQEFGADFSLMQYIFEPASSSDI